MDKSPKATPLGRLETGVTSGIWVQSPSSLTQYKEEVSGGGVAVTGWLQC